MRDLDFKDFFDNYKRFAKIATNLSQDFNFGIDNNGRLEIIVSGFNKLLLIYTSLIKLIPTDDGAFDLSSMSSISRVLIELSNKLYFFGLDSNVSQEELEFRLELYNYFSIVDRQEIADKLNIKKDKKVDYELTDNDVSNCENKLKSLPFYNQMIQQGKIQELSDLKSETNKKNKYYKKNKFQEYRGINIAIANELQAIYSKFVHSSPAVFDIHRDYLKNYETRSQNDKKMAFVMLDFVTSYFATTITELKDFVNNWESNITKTDIELINNYSVRIK